MNKLQEYFRYWGKAEKGGDRFHLLPYHCLDVAAVGNVLLIKNPQLQRKFMELTGLDKKICNYWMLMFLGLHDIGKFSLCFQGLREDLFEKLQNRQTTKRYTVRHDSLGHLLWKDKLWKSSALPEMKEAVDYWEEILTIYSAAFTGHHGKPSNLTGPNNLRLRVANFFERSDIEAADAFVHDLQAFLRQQHEPALEKISPFELYERAKLSSWLFAGLVVLCDWIGSNSTWFHFEDKPMPLAEYWEKHAMPRAIDATHKAGMVTSLSAEGFVPFSKVFPAISKPTPLQHFVADCPVANSPQLFILEDITGSGKTEAALFLARRLMANGLGRGLFFALPTMATSNAMFERMAQIYRHLFDRSAIPSIVLAHGARHLSETFMNSIANPLHGRDDYEKDDETATAQCAAWLADNRKKALLGDVGVGTLDQALLAILPSRFQSLRLFGLAEHILIVDEVHAYDPYMNMLLQNLLKFHASLGGSAILLSATLPLHSRQAMLNSFAKGIGIESPQASCDGYPLVTWMTREGFMENPVEATPQRRKSFDVRIVAEQSDIERLIVEASRQGKCACWLRNTVHDALAGHEALVRELPAEKLMLFHARFSMGDRLDIEKRVCSTFGKESTEIGRCGMVLVATQVVEQSLDLDFDLLISDLAPMDLLIQRAGRLHRHLRDERGNPLPPGHSVDRREQTCFIIHSPEPVENADRDWYKHAFSKAAYVYPSHGCLWLTARLLCEEKVLRMPDNARRFIEAAFGETADRRIPAPLQDRDLEAEGKMMCDKSAAHLNMLKIEEGYAATPNQWLEDMRTPTRLGDTDTTVRLARWDGANLFPWYPDSDFPWDMSQVNIHSTRLSSEAEIQNPALKQAIEKLKLNLPDKGKWSVLVPLMPSDGGECWQGEARDKDGKSVVVSCSRKLGVTVTRKE